MDTEPFAGPSVGECDGPKWDGTRTWWGKVKGWHAE
jgi:hypothetical protein